MQDKSTFLLAADSEGEMDEWISTLNKILHSSFEQAMQEKRNGDLHDGVFSFMFSIFLTSCGLQLSYWPHSVYVAIKLGACCTCRPIGEAETIASLCFNIITPSNRALDDVSNRWRTWKNRPLLWKFSRQLSGCLLIPSVVTWKQCLPPQFAYPNSDTIWISPDMDLYVGLKVWLGRSPQYKSVWIEWNCESVHMFRMY